MNQKPKLDKVLLGMHFWTLVNRLDDVGASEATDGVTWSGARRMAVSQLFEWWRIDL